MPKFRNTNGLLIVVLFAAVGLLLIYVPGKVIDLYERVKDLGPPYTYFYWSMVGSGVAILVLLSGGIVFKLWQATHNKALHASRAAKNPSQLSADEKQREVADN